MKRRRPKYRDCTICGERFELGRYNGNAVTCGPECSKERRRQTKLAHRQVYAPIYREQHREEISRGAADWYARNRDRKNLASKEWYEANREHVYEGVCARRAARKRNAQNAR